MPPILRLGKPPTTGPAVRKIQQQLQAQGFPPGTIDGVFGPATRAAVQAFQKARGLKVDGEVGPATRQALAAPAPAAKPKAKAKDKPAPAPAAAANGEAALIAAALGAPATNVSAHWDAIRQALDEQGLTNRTAIIAVVATIGTEVPAFLPINEFGGDDYFKKMYEGRADLGNTNPGDGVRYHGRGFIQLTGRANYRDYGQKLGVPLEDDPDLALDPAIAARVLAKYFNDRSIGSLAEHGDWRGVRRAVNGGLNGWSRFNELVGKLEQSL